MGRLLLIVAFATGILFTAFPGIDLWMSGQFYRPEAGFHLKDAAWAVAIYDSIPIIAIALGGGSLLLLVLSLVRGRRVGPLSNRFLLFLLAVLALGPGLVVNAGFKDHWGRARPRDIQAFGGERTFTPALQPTDQCERNCSFVAGHPSVAFWLAALGYGVAAGRRRNRIFLTGAFLGLVAGAGRVVQGGHFASDVIFSGISVFAVMWILAAFVFRLDEHRGPGRDPVAGAPSGATTGGA